MHLRLSGWPIGCNERRMRLQEAETVELRGSNEEPYVCAFAVGNRSSFWISFCLARSPAGLSHHPWALAHEKEAFCMPLTKELISDY